LLTISYCAVQPPSTVIAVPVIWSAAAERKATVPPSCEGETKFTGGCFSFYWTSGVSNGELRLLHDDEPEDASASSMRSLIVRAQRPHSALQPRQP
jgi:hypothetical protein